MGSRRKPWSIGQISWYASAHTFPESYLEDMKTFVLHHFPVVFEERHADLEVITRLDVRSHYVVVCSVQ